MCAFLWGAYTDHLGPGPHKSDQPGLEPRIKKSVSDQEFEEFKKNKKNGKRYVWTPSA
jgi:hypothetical protein